MNSVLNKTKKFVILAIVTLLMCMNLLAVSARSAEAPVSGKIVEIKETVKVYSEKSTDSEVLVTFKAGDAMFVTGDTGDGWYTVAYQGKIGYVSKTVSSPSSDESEGTASNSNGEANTTGASADNTSTINNKEETHELELVDFGEQMQEEMEEEMAQTNIETSYLAEEVVRYQESKTNAIIWVVIISVMAIILIVVGFISYRLRIKRENINHRRRR